MTWEYGPYFFAIAAKKEVMLSLAFWRLYCIIIIIIIFEQWEQNVQILYCKLISTTTNDLGTNILSSH